MLKKNKPILLYVGCGHHRMTGFIHVEIGVGKTKSGPPDIVADISDHMPLEDNSVDLIFSRATLEHLTYKELLNHFLECYRILKKNGCVRIIVPDLEMLVKEYENKICWPDLKKNPQGLPNDDYIDNFVTTIYYHDHFYYHNFNTLFKALEKTGFEDIRACEPGDTKIEEAREEIFKAEIGRYEDVIVEATKSDRAPIIKKTPVDYPRNFIKKFLAKYFNIGLAPFIR